MPDDPYDVLGLDDAATADDVRRAYFRLVRQYPPEVHPEEFKRIRAAYETLRSPVRRAELALFSFDESVTEVDLELVEGATRSDEFDAGALLLAIELNASELRRTAFPDDLTPLREEDLLG